MKELIKNLNDFEERNNLSVSVELFADCSSILKDFWDHNELSSFIDLDGLNKYLKEVNYKKSEDGRCLKSHVILCNYCKRDEVCEGAYPEGPEGCFLENDLDFYELQKLKK